jgi:hypothetical protein
LKATPATVQPQNKLPQIQNYGDVKNFAPKFTVKSRIAPAALFLEQSVRPFLFLPLPSYNAVQLVLTFYLDIMAPRKKPTKATCASCGKDSLRKAMEKHLATCNKHITAMATANAKADGSPERLFHLQVEAAHKPEMWFDIEMRGKATLHDLDNYIRAIWLDCGCGHLSSFTEINHSFGPGVSMEDTIEEVFQKRYTELRHSYDNGCNQAYVTCEGVREGQPLTEHPIVLLARNQLPFIPCTLCGELSTRICVKCWYPPAGEGYFCQHHVQNHFCFIDEEEEEYLIKPMLNSPRSGICGYCGPAEPPY